MKRYFFLALALFVAPCAAHAADPLVVHEWGTFTALQDEQGIAQGRINTDDEPVPPFVHIMRGAAVPFAPTAAADLSDGKSTPIGDTNITMRLETPVIYFHLPKNAPPRTVDVNVSFRGGWLSQFYPQAQADVEGVTLKDKQPLPPVTSSTVGRLAWKGLQLNGTGGVMPKTREHVWTAPRAVDSAPVAAGGEREQFLFYRGVGRLDSPVKISRDKDVLTVSTSATAIAALWLVDTKPDGRVAFRTIPGISPGQAQVVPGDFAAAEYAEGNLPKLRAALHLALVADGLYTDEAQALLATWELSYFKNPGERVFFLVPHAWTDQVLPLTLSEPADITRVMVGRVELITPAQRELLNQMAQLPRPSDQDLKEVSAAMAKLRQDPLKRDAYNALASGRGNLADLGVPVPAAYADFLALGRFRTAILLNSKENAGTLVNLAMAIGP